MAGLMGAPAKLCPECGAKVVEYPHSLSEGLVRSLAKLRYWTLVRQVEASPTRGPRGRWSVTADGERYLVGELAMEPIAWTFRGKFQRFEGVAARIETPLPRFYKRRPDYAREAKPRRPDDDEEPTTGNLFSTED